MGHSKSAWGRINSIVSLGLGLAAVSAAAHAAPMDAATAESVLKSNNCVKCHAVDRKKDGPAYRDVAAKFKAEADAENKVIHHITSGEMVKFPDGHEERHKKLKATEPDQARSLAQWILSLPGGTKY